MCTPLKQSKRCLPPCFSRSSSSWMAFSPSASSSSSSSPSDAVSLCLGRLLYVGLDWEVCMWTMGRSSEGHSPLALVTSWQWFDAVGTDCMVFKSLFVAFRPHVALSRGHLLADGVHGWFP